MDLVDMGEANNHAGIAISGTLNTTSASTKQLRRTAQAQDGGRSGRRGGDEAETHRSYQDPAVRQRDRFSRSHAGAVHLQQSNKAHASRAYLRAKVRWDNVPMDSALDATTLLAVIEEIGPSDIATDIVTHLTSPPPLSAARSLIAMHDSPTSSGEGGLGGLEMECTPQVLRRTREPEPTSTVLEKGGELQNRMSS